MLKIDTSRQSIALFLLFCAMVISAITGINYYGSQDAIYKFLTHVAMFIAMISVVRKPSDLLCIAAMYLIIMAMYLGKAQWEYFVYGRHTYTQGVPRLLGIDKTYQHYNSVAGSALLTLPFLQLLWSMRTDLGESFSINGRRLLKLSLLGYGFLAVTSVLLTNSRGGMLGLIIFAFLASVTDRTAMRAIRTLLLAAVILIPVVMFAVPETQRQRFSTLWNGHANSSAQGSLEVRKLAVQDGLKIFAEHPLTGIGFENFKRYRRQRGDASDLEAHNIFVQTLGEMGIVGGVAFGLFVFYTWLNFRTIRLLAEEYPSDESEFLRKLALAGRNSLLLLLYFGMLGSNIDRFNWYWLAGLGVAGVTMARNAYFTSDPLD